MAANGGDSFRRDEIARRAFEATSLPLPIDTRQVIIFPAREGVRRMTEAEWLASNDPAAMLDFVRGSNPLRAECPMPPPSDRKLRLWCCACARLSSSATIYRPGYEDLEREDWEPSELEEANHIAILTNAWATDPRHIAGRAPPALKAALLRDIVGNPFAPPVPSVLWLSPAVVGIARRIYDERDFAALPVLADALEDAGCTDADIIDHLRSPGPHVRGCWALDLILGETRVPAGAGVRQ